MFNKLKSNFENQSFFKKIAISFISVLVVIGIIGGIISSITEIIMDPKEEEVIEEKPVEEKREPTKQKVESKKKVEKEVTNEAKKDNDHTDLSESNIEYMYEYYQMIIDDYGGMVVSIEPRTEDYREVNVMIDDLLFNVFDVEDKQIYIDKIGSDVEGTTRSAIYKTPATDFILVYFVNEDGEEIVQTETFEKAWKVY